MEAHDRFAPGIATFPDEDERESLGRALEQQSKALAALGDVVLALRDRLEPVLTPQPMPTTEATAREMKVVSEPLASQAVTRIRSDARNVETVVRDLTTLIARLEV